jgi:hypothetical protein
LTFYNAERYHRFKLSFDVRVKIVEVLPGDSKKIEPQASLSLEDELICQTAVLHSVKSKITGDTIKPGSGTHQAKFWRFPQQTAVRITIAHQEIVNALNRRATKEEPRRALPEGS